MKRILTLAAALLILVSIVACGKSPESSGTAQPTDNAGESQQPANGSDTDKASPEGGETEKAGLTGKLDIFELDDRDPSVLRGVRISGLSAGDETFNGKDPSLDDVRCVFELNEWIEFYPDADAEYSLRVWILNHRDDPEYYSDCRFSDLMPGFVSYCDLHYPVDEENPEEWHWGSFYLNPEECEAGYYDFVFTYEGKAIALLKTRFFNVDELSGKSASELEALCTSDERHV